MFNPSTIRISSLMLATIAGGLGIALAVAFLVFEMRGRDLGFIALYLLISGAVSLALGFAVSRFGLRSNLGIRHKTAIAGAAGSVIALVNVTVTALLMFISTHDLTVLVVLLLFSLIISVFFSFAVSRHITSSIESLTQGAQLMAEGDLSTRLDVSSSDEVGELAQVMNKMASELEQAFRRQRELEQARKDRSSSEAILFMTLALLRSTS